MQTLVMVPAIISVLRPVASTAATKSGLSQALISPLRATYLACGAFSWISGISGPLGPCGTEAVVMTGSLLSVAILARAAARRRNSGMGMSPTVWNRPLWWSISSMAVSAGSIAGRLPLKFAGWLMVLLLVRRACCGTIPAAIGAAGGGSGRGWYKAAVVEVAHGLLDFLLGIHHEWAVAHYGFVDRFSGQ
ncbi:hypothetical protein D3C81_1281070 [compost metagenome]